MQMLYGADDFPETFEFVILRPRQSFRDILVQYWEVILDDKDKMNFPSVTGA